MPSNSSLEDILLSQIEAHRTEVFYNMDPMVYGSRFLRRLPATVKRKICWRAAPSGNVDFSGYHQILNNFPSILKSYRDNGLDARYFCPAHDPVLDGFAARSNRPIDILFVGGYSQHHRRRAEILEAVAGMQKTLAVRFCLQRSRFTKLAESPIGAWLPLGKYRRPSIIRSISSEPAYGVDLYAQLAQAKVVLNGAIDMAGDDRGNMRCFESLGAGCAMVSDVGRYPEHFRSGETHLTYKSAADAVDQIAMLLRDPTRRSDIASNGYQMLRTQYSSVKQWEAFLAICN